MVLLTLESSPRLNILNRPSYNNAGIKKEKKHQRFSVDQDNTKRKKMRAKIEENFCQGVQVQ